MKLKFIPGYIPRKAGLLFRVTNGFILDFSTLNTTVTEASRSEVTEESDQVTAESKVEAAHLPPKLRYLERLANDAIRKFFARNF